MESNNRHILIAYFSHSGNTRILAEEIQKKVGGDLFEIAANEPYPQDYDTVVSVARQEKAAHSRPELAAKIDNMDAYDVIFIGYPNWWSTMPMVVFNFLEQYDLCGKKIVPFCTHGGNRFGTSEKDISTYCPNAKVLRGFAVRGSRVNSAQMEIAKWLREVGLLEP